MKKIILLFVIGLMPCGLVSAASFSGLGYVDDSGTYNSSSGVSNNGVVVGSGDSNNGQEAFRWQNGIMNGLGDLIGGSFESFALGVSADGAVVVGQSISANGNEAFRWENGVMIGLGDLPGGIFSSVAYGVSADSTTIVGRGDSNNGWEAFRWQNGIMNGLGDLIGGSFESFALGVSADGAVVVGQSHSANGEEAFRWENGVMIGLGSLPNADFFFYSEAFDVSADGSVVVGESMGDEDDMRQAFRWENGTMTGLGYVDDGGFESSAFSVTDDGATVVGGSDSDNGYVAFIWDNVSGMQNLQDVLTNDYGLDLTGWTLGYADAISGNGHVIAGTGTNPDGEQEAWVAKLIDEPANFSHFATLAQSWGTTYDMSDLVVLSDAWLTNEWP